MAEEKKACIVYVHDDGCDPGPLQKKLEAAGYAVTRCPVSRGDACKAQAGALDELSMEVRDALVSAHLCIILISECTGESSELAEAVTCAVSGGGDIVGIWAEGQADCQLPAILVDYGCDIVSEIDPEFQEIIDGKVSAWKGPTGQAAQGTKIFHQKKC